MLCCEVSRVNLAVSPAPSQALLGSKKKSQTPRSKAGTAVTEAVKLKRVSDECDPSALTKRSASGAFEETCGWHGHCSNNIGSLRDLMKVLSCWAAASRAGKMARVVRRFAIFQIPLGASPPNG